MKASSSSIQTVDDYIASFPADVQSKLRKVRAAIRKAAPKAEETISYRIAAYRQAGQLIYFAAFKHHIGLYPRAKGPAALLKKVAPYEVSKGTYRFALDEPIPFELITEITRARARENAELAKDRPRRAKTTKQAKSNAQTLTARKPAAKRKPKRKRKSIAQR